MGVLRTAPAPGQGLNLAETRSAVPGKRSFIYHEPTLVGSIHVLFNQGHGFAAVLEGSSHITFTRANGSHSEPQMLLRVDSCWSKQQRREQQRGAGGLVELTWHYAATTTDLDDPLLRVRCLCASCAADPSTSRPLLTYQPM